MDDRDHYNELTPAEAERLAILIEEASEVQKIACKILRHGYRSHNPDDPQAGDNRRMLARELGDLEAAIDTMKIARDVGAAEVEIACRDRIERLTSGEAYLHHQGDWE